MTTWNLYSRSPGGLVAGEELTHLAAHNPKVVVLTADMMHSARLQPFASAFPERFFNFGCAEQNMVSAAAGLAATEKLPFVATFAAYGALLCAEQLRTDVAANGLPVTVLASHAGISLSLYGMSHYAIEDLAVLRAIGSFAIASATDGQMLRALVRYAVAHPGPFYIRLGDGRDPDLYSEVPEYAPGRSWKIEDGSDLTIVSTGAMTHRALEAAATLRRAHIAARVVDMVSIHPLDTGAIEAAAADTGHLLVVEEHRLAGGLASAVAEYLAGNAIPARFGVVAIRDLVVPTGPRDDLYRACGLDPTSIVVAARSLLAS